MVTNFTCNTLEDWTKIAKEIMNKYPKASLFALTGPMGAGKTTLVQCLCSELNVVDKATSPTYSIVNEYKRASSSEPVYHMDFYRLNDIEEALDIGCEELFYSKRYCFIEWPEIIETLLPSHYVQVRIAKAEEHTQQRHIQTRMV